MACNPQTPVGQLQLETKGVVNVSKKSQSKFSLGNARGTEDVSEWLKGVDASSLLLAIDSVLAVGCGITFSVSRDGKTLCITVLDNGTKERAYCSDANSLIVICESLELQAAASSG